MTRVGLEPTTSSLDLYSRALPLRDRSYEKPRPFHSHKLHDHSPSAETNLSGLFDSTLHLPKGDNVLEYKSRGRGFESYSSHFHSHKLSRLIFQILLLLMFNCNIQRFSILHQIISIQAHSNAWNCAGLNVSCGEAKLRT